MPKIAVSTEELFVKALKKKGYKLDSDKFTPGKEWIVGKDGIDTIWYLFCGCLKMNNENANTTLKLSECEVSVKDHKLSVAVKNKISSVIFNLN
jgi:hypothetical protein